MEILSVNWQFNCSVSENSSDNDFRRHWLQWTLFMSFCCTLKNIIMKCFVRHKKYPSLDFSMTWSTEHFPLWSCCRTGIFIHLIVTHKWEIMATKLHRHKAWGHYQYCSWIVFTRRTAGLLVVVCDVIQWILVNVLFVRFEDSIHENN